MKGCHYVGPDIIHGRLYDLVSFPALKRETSGIVPVVVDLYELPESPDDFSRKLLQLDHYEGCFQGKPDQSLFNRVRTLTIGRDSKWCWTYEFRLDVSAFNEIPTGDWLER